jgi:ferredoxin
MHTITINDREITIDKPRTVLEAALENGIYIPHLCFYSGLGTARSMAPAQAVYRGEKEIKNEGDDEYEGCNLCLVKVEGKEGLCHACTTPADEGMRVYSETPEVQTERRGHLENILKSHPHVCLTCELAEGCNRKICSMDIPEEARCCWKFGNCEFQKVAAYVGFEEGIPYAAQDEAEIDDNPLFLRNYSLCIHCLRCVTACREIAGRDAVGFVNRKGTPVVGTTGPTLKESKCKYCLACVDVCPTGALRLKEPEKEKSKLRMTIAPPIFPPEEEGLMVLDQENVLKVPEAEGVFRLFNDDRELIKVTGTEHLRESLSEELEDRGEALYFNYEEDEMFTMRERQIIQQYMKKHGKMPPGNDELDELF